MAKKFDDELIDVAKLENKEFHNNGGSSAVNSTASNNSKSDSYKNETGSESKKENSETNTGTSNNSSTNAGVSPDSNTETFTNQNFDSELKDKFDAFSRGAGALAGPTIVAMIDDLKCNGLYMYALKNKVNVPNKDVFKLDQNGRELAALLIDQATKGKVVEWMKNNPIAGAGIVFGLSALTSFGLIQMLKTQNDEKEKMAAELEKLKAEKLARESQYTDPLSQTFEILK